MAYNKIGWPKLEGTPKDTHARWMNSNGHRANIQNSVFNKVGYAYYVCDRSNRIYWCGFFGED